jgi:hypothetical protein
MWRFRHPSPAMGVALFALFIALGGASMAATSDFLPKNSVGTAQMQNNSVTRAKIAHQSITNVLIRPGSLMASSFAAGQIPAGPKGDTGATGATGAAGVVATLSLASRTVHVDGGVSDSATVQVPSGTQPITVTASWGSHTGQYGGYISISPLMDGSKIVGYTASGFNSDTTGHNFTLYVAYG